MVPSAGLALWGFPPPSHSTGSLGVRKPGRQQVLVFPRKDVVLALARESHPGGSCQCV